MQIEPSTNFTVERRQGRGAEPLIRVTMFDGAADQYIEYRIDSLGNISRSVAYDTAKFSPGAADPLLFSYPNFAKFRSNAKQSLKDQLPTKQLVEQVAKDTEKAN